MDLDGPEMTSPVLDLEHLTCGRRIRAPRLHRDRAGRYQATAAGEWDWLAELSTAERRAFSVDLLTSDPKAPGPDEVATMTGYLDVTTWAERLIAEWRAARRPADEERPGPDVGPVVGLAEVAELLCVQPTTAYQWRTRGLLPEPDMTVSRQPAWWLSTIQGWAAATGRA